MDDALVLRNGQVSNQMIIEIDFKEIGPERSLWMP
ncbi:hypothetical protein JOH51_006453 [Rhizobium leguminosarum]|nr:hypothetical protein [Rhizobium leguminosarum]